MPELPDVEVFRRAFDAKALHRKIQKLVSLDKSLVGKTAPGKFRSTVEGKKFEESTRHGKYLFAALAKESFLVFHFGMTGSLKFLDDGGTPAHTRMLLELEKGSRLAYVSIRKLGRVFLAKSVDSFVKQKKLGPDALAISFEAFNAALQNRRGAVKPALMDQQNLAGLGNVYTDEILFQAGIRPQRDCNQIDPKQWRKLYRTMQSVLKIAIRKQARRERFPASYLSPHRRPDAECPRCGAPFKIGTVGGRTTYYCPNDQK